MPIGIVVGFGVEIPIWVQTLSPAMQREAVLAVQAFHERTSHLAHQYRGHPCVDCPEYADD